MSKGYASGLPPDSARMVRSLVRRPVGRQKGFLRPTGAFESSKRFERGLMSEGPADDGLLGDVLDARNDGSRPPNQGISAQS